MNRLLWGITLMVLATAGWAQSTWRGQAEVWSSAPSEGYVAATNEFPRNTLLSVENYRTKKTVQVRVVAALPAGSSALILLNSKAASALEIKAGDVPLVGVRIDTDGLDRPDNPDPDVNPLAQKPAAVAVVPTPIPTPVPVVPTPAIPVTPAATPVAPTVVAAPLPLPAIAEPATVPEPTRTPLAVADEPEPTPVTPGKKVFLSTHESDPIAAETPAVETPVAVEPESEVEPEPELPAEPELVPEPAIAESPEPEPEPEPVAETPEAEPEPAIAEAPVAEPTLPVATIPTAPVSGVTAVPVPVAAPPASAWVSTPAKVQGPVLGQVALLAGLEKGRNYVQVGAWATEAELLKTLDSVTTYVPLALYRAEGEKNPWRLIVVAPRAQLGVLLNWYKTQGYRATVVKG